MIIDSTLGKSTLYGKIVTVTDLPAIVRSILSLVASGRWGRHSVKTLVSNSDEFEITMGALGGNSIGLQNGPKFNSKVKVKVKVKLKLILI